MLLDFSVCSREKADTEKALQTIREQNAAGQ